MNRHVLDYPMLRAATDCTICGKPKDRGNIVCWRCYRVHEFRQGESERIRAILDQAEAARAALSY
jgi:hypothetical protein